MSTHEASPDTSKLASADAYAPSAFDPYGAFSQQDPKPFYVRLRDESPVHYDERYDCWYLSRFEDVWREEQDLEAYTVVGGPTPSQLLKRVRGMPEEKSPFEDHDFGDALATLDPPTHTQVRGQLSPHFKPRAARALEDLTRKLVRGYVDELVEKRGGDVIGELAMRTSVRIACTIVGFPLEKADWLAERVNRMNDRDDSGREFSEHAFEGLIELHMYFHETVARARQSPSDEPNLLNALLRAEANGQPITDGDVASNLFLMIVGGTETLPKVFSAAVKRLAEHPDQRAAVVADPSLVPGAFREALRMDMPTQMLGRRVRQEKVVQGHRLLPEQGLLFLWASANRDPREFPDPDRYDIHRNAPRLLSFGSGAHMCLGAHVAQMEGRVMLEELLARIPEYEIVPEGVERIRTEMFQGLGTLPIRF